MYSKNKPLISNNKAEGDRYWDGDCSVMDSSIMIKGSTNLINDDDNYLGGNHGTVQPRYHLPIAHREEEGGDCSKYDGSKHANRGDDHIGRSSTFASRTIIKNSTTSIYDTHRDDYKTCNNDDEGEEICPPLVESDDAYFDYDSVLEYSSTVQNGIAQDDIADRRRRLPPPVPSIYDDDDSNSNSTSSQLTLMRSIILSVADELDMMSEDCWDALSISGLSPSAAADIIKLFKAKIGLLQQFDRIQEKEEGVPTIPSSPSSMRSETSRRGHGGEAAGYPPRPPSIGPVPVGKDSASDPVPSTDSAVGCWEVVGDDDDDWNPHPTHSLPPFGLRSPEIAHLLHTWTSDEGKIKHLLGWIEGLSLEATDSDHPPGIQITNISSILRDGIMLLLVPLMRVQSHQPLLVLSRRRPAETARRVSSPDSGDTEEASSFDSDPFLAMSDFVHDVRIVPARKYTAIDERGQPLEKHPDTSYHCFLDVGGHHLS